MEDERDAEDAIRALDRTEFGRKGRRLRVEWTKHERGVRRPSGGSSRRSSVNNRPSKTLFVINFDPYHTRPRDLERHFEPYGKIVSVRIRRNFAFVQYDSQEDATKALDATNMRWIYPYFSHVFKLCLEFLFVLQVPLKTNSRSDLGFSLMCSKLVDRVISVEYAARDDDERRNGYSPDRSRDRSPERGRDRRRSPSPYRRERGSPDYGHGPTRSPYRRERGSPNYGHDHSVSPYRRDRGSPNYDRGTSHSPYQKERSAADRAHGSSRSPAQRERASPDNGHGPGHSPYRREKRSTENERSPSRSPYGKERAIHENGRGPSDSPYERERNSPENGNDPSPSSVPEQREDSPYGGGAESPVNGGYNSQTPPADE
ncbi:hypothetical protein SLEP1_g17081 [Rubroshorea leprosula]|nr:hypothetical protein SLEP1_g17081 [Rubroshorea leprosula]